METKHPKAEFNEKVTELIERTKAGDPELLDRQKRIKIIDELIENYVTVTGKIPDPYELERLGSLILREELTSKNLHKVAHEERPVMSERQLERRSMRELNVDVTHTQGIDGKDYRRPTKKV
jgi:hypothetical protein